MALNLAVLMGNMTRDVELKNTPSGFTVANFTIAINSTRKGRDGQKVDEVSFIDCTAFGKQAETIAKFFRKGSRIIVEGRLKQESWDDKSSGQKRSKIVVIVEEFSFVDKAAQQSHPHDDPNNWPGETAGVGSDKGPPNDDDIPF